MVSTPLTYAFPTVVVAGACSSAKSTAPVHPSPQTPHGSGPPLPHDVPATILSAPLALRPPESSDAGREEEKMDDDTIHKAKLTKLLEIEGYESVVAGEVPAMPSR
jgi:hypothetical protein